MFEKLAKYKSLDSESDKSETDGFLGEKAQCNCSRRRGLSRVAFLAPWLLAAFFAALSLVLFLNHPASSLESYEDGFDTDFRTSKDPNPWRF